MKKEALEKLYLDIPRENKRAHAVLLFKEGYTLQEISKIFFIDEDTARSWKRQWQVLSKLKDAQRNGASKKITSEIEKEMCKVVDENNPQKEGMFATTWDCRELKIWMKKKFKVEITEERIRQILKQNKFNYRKLNYKFTKADEEKQVQFKENFKCFVKDKRGTMLFMDEMKSKLHPHQGRTWTREKKPFIETDCSHKGTYVIGGVNPKTGETYTMTNEKFNSNVFIEFLKLILTRIAGKIWLVLDNHPSHYSEKTRKFLMDCKRIEFFFLPKYSPDFNPKENWWNYLRKKFLNNCVFETVKEMAKGIKKFMKKVQKEDVKSVCSIDYLLR